MRATVGSGGDGSDRCDIYGVWASTSFHHFVSAAAAYATICILGYLFLGFIHTDLASTLFSGMLLFFAIFIALFSFYFVFIRTSFG